MSLTFQDIQTKIDETFALRLSPSFLKAYHSLFYEIIEWDALGAKQEEVQKALQIFTKRRDKKIKDRSLGDTSLSRVPNCAFMQRMIEHLTEHPSEEEIKKRFLAFESALGRALPLAFNTYRKDELVLMQNRKDIGFYQAFHGHPHDPIPQSLLIETWRFEQFAKIIPLDDPHPQKNIKITERTYTPEEAVHIFWSRTSSKNFSPDKGQLIFDEGYGDHSFHRLFGDIIQPEPTEEIKYATLVSFGFILLNTLIESPSESSEKMKKYETLADFFIQHRISKTPTQVESNNHLLLAPEQTLKALSRHLNRPFHLTQEAAHPISTIISKTEKTEEFNTLVNNITSNPFLYASFAQNSHFIWQTYLRLKEDKGFKHPQIEKDIEDLNLPIPLSNLSKHISKVRATNEIALPLISKWAHALQDPDKRTHQKWDTNLLNHVGFQINHTQFTAELIHRFCAILDADDKQAFLANALFACNDKDPKTETYKTLLENIPVDISEFEIFSQKIKTFTAGFYSISKNVKERVIQDMEHQFLKNTYAPKNSSTLRKAL